MNVVSEGIGGAENASFTSNAFPRGRSLASTGVQAGAESLDCRDVRGIQMSSAGIAGVAADAVGSSALSLSVALALSSAIALDSPGAEVMDSPALSFADVLLLSADGFLSSSAATTASSTAVVSAAETFSS